MTYWVEQLVDYGHGMFGSFHWKLVLICFSREYAEDWVKKRGSGNTYRIIGMPDANK